MNANRSLEAIVTQWQAELDAGLEIGETPVFYLGQGPAMLGELAGPLALQWLDEQRRDTRMPLATGGGLAPFWLAALLHQRSADAPLLSPATVFSFTGPDPATHAAALNLLDTRRSQFRRRPADLPPGFQPAFVANVQAGPFVAEALPLQLASLSSQAATMNSPASHPPDHTPAYLAAGRDGWVAWTAVVVAVVMLLIALVA
jgi:hypothetical protein